MNKCVAVLIVLAKGELLMETGAIGGVAGFTGMLRPGEVPVRAAVRVLGEETALDAHTDDLEFLNTYFTGDQEVETQVFILAGVSEDRVHAYSGEESLIKIQRSDDFEAAGLSELARKYVIDYFRSHKKW